LPLEAGKNIARQKTCNFSKIALFQIELARCQIPVQSKFNVDVAMSQSEKTYPKAYFYKKIVSAKLYIDENYAEPIDVDQIASEACFSKFDFIRQFKRTYGKTPYNYLKTVRLTKAAELLKSSQRSIQDVCFSVGYTSLSSFSSLFKKEYSISPQKFQALHMERAKLIKSKPLNYIPGCFTDPGE